MKLIGPMIEERLRLHREYDGAWEGRADDVISWLLDEANTPEEFTVDALVARVMVMNAVSLHTTSMSLSFALVLLVEHQGAPRYAIEILLCISPRCMVETACR